MLSTSLFCLLLLAYPVHDRHTPVPAERSGIVIDGEFEDWRAMAPALVDPVDAPDATIDLGEVRISHDHRFLHLLINVGRNVNLQGMAGTLTLLLDADGDRKTGPQMHGLAGVDVLIDFSPQTKPDQQGMGVGLRSTTHTPKPDDSSTKLNPYDIGLMFSPTFAARRFEIRIERGGALPQTPALFRGNWFVGKLIFTDLSGRIADEVEPFTHKLDEPAQPQTAMDEERNPLARMDASDLRVMSWNVERGAMLAQPEPFRRTLAAVKPDVILLQELKDTDTAERIMEFILATAPLNVEGQWHVLVGEGGGDLRCAVVSRFPVRIFQPLRALPMPDRPDRTLRAVGAVVACGERRLLVVSAHLRCCGNAHGPEDEQRRIEAQLIQSVLKSAVDAGDIEGIVVAGDFNLVGSRDPVELLAMGADLDRSNLTIAPTYQLDGLSNATWTDRAQPFTPGRLDYILYADSAMVLRKAFIFESHDLSEQWRTRHELQAGDSDVASDHLPVVADLVWIAP